MHNVSIIGTGRVASVLAPALANAGNNIVSVHSRNYERAKVLASSLSAIPSDNLEIPEQSEIILIMVQDDAIAMVSDSLKADPRTTVAHVAGSIGLDVFPERFIRKGVFYPLQTFTPGRDISLSEVPFLVEAGDEETKSTLTSLAKSVSGKVSYCDLGQRRILHVAAVFASNFTNNMLHNSNIIMSRSDLDFSMLEPLVKETVMKAFALGPGDAQTGPAFRNDVKTMEKQKELLSFDPLLQNLYETVSELIINYKKTL